MPVIAKPLPGVDWFPQVTALFFLAFLLYILSNGSFAKYKEFIFGSATAAPSLYTLPGTTLNPHAGP